MFVQREPSAALRPFVATTWAQQAPTLDRHHEPLDLPALRLGTLEHVLPTGAVHLVFRLGSSPLRVLDVRGRETRVVGAVVGAFIMGVMNNGMSILGIGIDWQQVIKGLVLLAAVVFDVYNKKKG